MAEPAPHHVSVLPAEVLAALNPQPGAIVVDCTAGAGGHTRLLAERVGPAGRVIALDRDESMLALAKVQTAGLPATFVAAAFDELPAVLRSQGISTVDAVLADLGICSDQLDDESRGFSFQLDGPLDMRLDRAYGEPAAALLTRLSERDLADLIYEYGEERFSRRIARRIVAARATGLPQTTAEFAALIRRCVPRSRGGIDPATRTFQALRIAVNDELGMLDRLLAGLPQCVRPGGRVAIISFHSLEDRRVKRAFRSPVWTAASKKPIVAGADETRANPRSRSAKLRAATRSEFNESLPR